MAPPVEDDSEQNTRPVAISNSKPRVMEPDISKKQIKDEQDEDEKLAQQPPVEPLRQANNHHLIDNKTYFVPIGQVTKRRNSKILVVTLAALIVIAVAVGFIIS